MFRFRGCSANWMPLTVVSRTDGVPMARTVRTVGPDKARPRACAEGTPGRSSYPPLQSVGQPRTWQCGRYRRRVRACLRPSAPPRFRCEPKVRAAKEPDGVALELLALGFVALDIRKTRDAVPLPSAMQRRPCQVRDRGPESREAIIQRQHVPSEGDDHCCLFLGQYRRPWFLRPSLELLDPNALAPLRHRLGVCAGSRLSCASEACDHSGCPSNQWRGHPHYCCSDVMRGRGAAMTSLSHSTSFDSCERIAPSNRGTRHLRPQRSCR